MSAGVWCVCVAVKKRTRYSIHTRGSERHGKKYIQKSDGRAAVQQVAVAAGSCRRFRLTRQRRTVARRAQQAEGNGGEGSSCSAGSSRKGAAVQRQYPAGAGASAAARQLFPAAAGLSCRQKVHRISRSLYLFLCKKITSSTPEGRGRSEVQAEGRKRA